MSLFSRMVDATRGRVATSGESSNERTTNLFASAAVQPTAPAVALAATSSATSSVASSVAAPEPVRAEVFDMAPPKGAFSFAADDVRRSRDPDLNAAILSHEAWLKSEGRLGSRIRLADHQQSGIDIRNAVLAGADMSGVDLTQASIKDTVMTDARMSGAKFGPNSIVKGVDFSGSRGDGVEMNGVNMSEVNFADARFTGLKAKGAHFDHAVVDGLRLDKPEIDGVAFARSKGEMMVRGGAITNSGFLKSEIGGRFTGVDMKGLEIHDSSFNPELRDVALTGSTATRADLSGIVVRDSDLSRANWREVKADGAKIEGTIMRDGNLEKTTFAGASFDRVRAQHTDFHRAYVGGAEIRDSNFTGANLLNVEGHPVDLAGSVMSSREVRLDIARDNDHGTTHRNHMIRMASEAPAVANGPIANRTGANKSAGEAR